MSRNCCRNGKCEECLYFRGGGWSRDVDARALAASQTPLWMWILVAPFYALFGGALLAGLYGIILAVVSP